VTNALIGKYFLGVHDEAWRSGVVEAATDNEHYLVRFNDLVKINHSTSWPQSLAVVAIDDMARAGRLPGDEMVPPPWLFFDNAEQQQAYEVWLNEPSPDRKPRVVPLRPDRD
jgi:hypothetical protein